jgi:hypothetical protein
MKQRDKGGFLNLLVKFSLWIGLLITAEYFILN